MSSSVSSKVTNTPLSPRSAPWTRNSRPNSVLPHPGPPHTSVGRPSGSPPPVISSKPSMPVGTLARGDAVEVVRVGVDRRLRRGIYGMLTSVSEVSKSSHSAATQFSCRPTQLNHGPDHL